MTGDSLPDDWELPDSPGSARLGFRLLIGGAVVGAAVLTGLLVSLFTGFFPFQMPGASLANSQVSGKCQPLWVDGARNDPALECYLSQGTGRLCDAAEREQLVAVMTRYRKERSSHEAGSVFGFFSGGSARTGYTPADLALQTYASQKIMNGQGLTPEERAKLIKSMQAMEQRLRDEKKRYDSSDEKKRDEVRVIGDVLLAELIQKLHVAGLMTRDDWGWSPDSLVKEATWGLPAGKADCRS